MDTVRQRHWWNFERRIMNSIFMLEQWIVAATKNLTPTAISSITKEITDHYQTSFEKYEARGISSIEAESLAVRDLGDPEKSANKFTQVYLTRSEEEKIEKMLEPFYLSSAMPGLFAFLIGTCLNVLLFTDRVWHVNLKISIWAISSTVNYLSLFLSHIFDVFIVKNLKNKNTILLLIKIKISITVISLISALTYYIITFKMWGIKNNSYTLPIVIAFYAISWVRNTYPILRKFANTPYRTPSI
jgi:hypothetical protein